MKIREPSCADLREMDDLLLEIQEKTFHLQICIRDDQKVEVKEEILFEILDTKDILIEQLEKLVRDWSYVPLCAACYLKYVTNCIFPIYTHNLSYHNDEVVYESAFTHLVMPSLLILI